MSSAERLNAVRVFEGKEGAVACDAYDAEGAIQALHRCFDGCGQSFGFLYFEEEFVADEVAVAAAWEAGEVCVHFLQELCGVDDVSVEGDGDFESVCFCCDGLCALDDGLVVAFAAGGVADVGDAYAAGQAGEPFLDGAGFQLRHQVQVLVSVEVAVVVCEEAVTLVSAVIFRSETPINVGKDRFIIEINCSEDAAAYVWFPLNMEIQYRKRRLLKSL